MRVNVKATTNQFKSVLEQVEAGHNERSNRLVAEVEVTLFLGSNVSGNLTVAPPPGEKLPGSLILLLVVEYNIAFQNKHVAALIGLRERKMPSKPCSIGENLSSSSFYELRKLLESACTSDLPWGWLDCNIDAYTLNNTYCRS